MLEERKVILAKKKSIYLFFEENYFLSANYFFLAMITSFSSKLLLIDFPPDFSPNSGPDFCS